jgi:hypothetical protein
VVQYLLSKCKALRSNSGTAKKKKKTVHKCEELTINVSYSH